MVRSRKCLELTTTRAVGFLSATTPERAIALSETMRREQPDALLWDARLPKPELPLWRNVGAIAGSRGRNKIREQADRAPAQNRTTAGAT